MPRDDIQLLLSTTALRHCVSFSGSTCKFRVVAMNMYGESPHSIPSKLYQVPQASPRIADRPVVGPHISSTDAISDTQIMLRWTVSTPLTYNIHRTSGGRNLLILTFCSLGLIFVVLDIITVSNIYISCIQQVYCWIWKIKAVWLKRCAARNLSSSIWYKVIWKRNKCLVSTLTYHIYRGSLHTVLSCIEE